MLELVGGGEFLLAANPLDELQLDAMPVDVAIEIENVRLDRTRGLVEGRAHPDVRNRSVVAVVEHHSCRINPIGRKAFGFAFEVGGRKSNRAAALASSHYGAMQEVIAPQQLPRDSHIAARNQFANLGR